MTTHHHTHPSGHRLAYIQHKRRAPHLVFLPGFKSDMQGSKALAVDAWCEAHGISFTCFDYSGHGQSDGAFLDGCISNWLEDTLEILDHVVAEPCIIVGSSMGGWLALLAALKRPKQITALTLIAPAPDFTEALIWQQATEAQQQSLMQQGYFDIPNCYDDAEPFRITKKLIEDGRKHLLLAEPPLPLGEEAFSNRKAIGQKAGEGKDTREGPSPQPSLKGRKSIKIACPIRLLHGMKDADVPWQLSARIAEQVASDDVEIHYIKNAGHRMSEPAQLELLRHTLASLCHSADSVGIEQNL